MSEVLIVARTHMNNGNVCIGGLDTHTDKLVRLMATDGWYFNERAPFRPRTLIEVTYAPKHALEPPHCEDVCVTKMSNTNIEVNVGEVLNGHSAVSAGSPRQLMDGHLTFSSPHHSGADAGALAAYLDRSHPDARTSLAIWKTDRVMTQVRSRSGSKQKIYYAGHPPVRGEISFQAKYTGFEDPPLIIPEGSLLSFSLARWWDPLFGGPAWEKCYLQLCDILWTPS